MTTVIRAALAFGLALVIAAPVAGTAEETFSGTLVCAKCFLKKADATECQDVLLVTDANGAKTEYYIVKNDVAKEAGEACTVEVPATVTGTVSEKEGRKWIAATKIEKKKS
jgi:hypothetical protein